MNYVESAVRKIVKAAGIILFLIVMLAAGVVAVWYEAGAQVDRTQHQRSLELGWRARLRRRRPSFDLPTSIISIDA